MKKLLLSAILLLSAQAFFAQCLEPATDFGNNTVIPMYNVTGTVEVTLNTDNTITLELGDDFMTAAGPDIRAYLVNSGGLSDSQLTTTPIAALENLEFGLVGSDTVNQNGAKTFTIDLPSGTNIEDFDKVFFYCLNFDQFWDFGTYISFTEATCGFLSVATNDLSELKLWPNPAQDQIQLSAPNSEALQVNIYNMQGQIVAQYDTIRNNQTIALTNLNSGLYLTEITSGDGSTTVRRMLIE